MDAKEYLIEYAALKMEALHNEERILEAFNSTQIPAMKQGDGSQRTPGRGDGKEKATLRYMELKDRLQPQIDANKAKMRQIEEDIDSLDDGMEREVLRLRYIDVDGWKPVLWRLVALKMYRNDEEKDLQRVQRVHKEALSSLDAVLAAKEKSPQ